MRAPYSHLLAVVDNWYLSLPLKHVVLCENGHVKVDAGQAYSTMDGVCAKRLRRIAVFDEIHQNNQEKEPGNLSPFLVYESKVGLGSFKQALSLQTGCRWSARCK